MNPEPERNVEEKTWRRAYLSLILLLGLAAVGYSALWAVIRLSSDDCTVVTTLHPDGARTESRTCN
jgi:hypothetical protein